MAIRVEVKPAHGWFKGERKQLAFPVKDADGVPVDITAWTLEWALMSKPTASTHLLSKETGAGITVEEGPEEIMNVALVNIAEDDLDAVRSGVELYQELKRTDVGQANVLAYGPVTLIPSGIVV
jgi:hypothetical protein